MMSEAMMQMQGGMPTEEPLPEEEAYEGMEAELDAQVPVEE